MDDLNKTIGDMLDTEFNVKRMILNLIEERKRKKQACDQNTLSTILLSRNISKETTIRTLSSLEYEGKIISNIYSGKITYRLNSLEDSENDVQTSDVEDFIDFEQSTNDFNDFKHYMTNRLSSLENSIESMKNSYDKNELNGEKLRNTLECKDTIINILREEILELRNQNKILLEYFSHKRQTHCCVSGDFCNQINDADSIDKDKSSHVIHSPEILKVKETRLKIQLADVREQKKLKYYEYVNLNKTTMNKTINSIDDINNKITSDSVTNGDLNKKVVSDKKQPVNNNDKRKCVIICGDSIINGIEGNGLSSKTHKTTVKSFSGASSDDMVDFIKPLAKKEAHNLIIHIGTNDIQNNIDTIKNIDTITQYIKKTSSNTRIAISSICIREDKNNILKKVSSINKSLEEFCRKNNVDFIKNSNIDSSHLSRKKLHLNDRGTSNLAKNFKKYITEGPKSN